MFIVSIETVKSKTRPFGSVEKVFFLMQEGMNIERNFRNIEILRKQNLLYFPGDQSLSVYYYCFIFKDHPGFPGGYPGTMQQDPDYLHFLAVVGVVSHKIYFSNDFYSCCF